MKTAEKLRKHNETILSMYSDLISILTQEEIKTLKTHLEATSKELTDLRLKYVKKLDDGPPAP